GAASNLVALGDKMVDATERVASSTGRAAQCFASSARMIDGSGGRLTELSTSTLKDIPGIAMRFDEHVKVLSSAPDLLGSAQNDLASTLDGRQEALESLAVGLVKKSEDIERVMRSFEDLVGGALEKAENRTRSSTE